MIKNTGKKILATLLAALAVFPALQIRARADVITDPIVVIQRYFRGDWVTLALFILSILIFIGSIIALVLTLVKCSKKGKKLGLAILFGVLILASLFFIVMTIADALYLF